MISVSTGGGRHLEAQAVPAVVDATVVPGEAAADLRVGAVAEAHRVAVALDRIGADGDRDGQRLGIALPRRDRHGGEEVAVLAGRTGCCASARWRTPARTRSGRSAPAARRRSRPARPTPRRSDSGRRSRARGRPTRRAPAGSRSARGGSAPRRGSRCRVRPAAGRCAGGRRSGGRAGCRVAVRSMAATARSAGSSAPGPVMRTSTDSMSTGSPGLIRRRTIHRVSSRLVRLRMTGS